MISRVLLVAAALLFASGVLVTSIFRTTTATYLFPQQLNPDRNNANLLRYEPVDYFLAYPGILPDNNLWELKVLRDKMWLFLTTDPVRRGELLLLFADKRISAAQVLLKKGNPGLAISTATKAEKYLEEAVSQEAVARTKGRDTRELLTMLSTASLKHREVLEEMYILAPEEARPVIVETMDYPRKFYNETKVQLIKMDVTFPDSPFEP